MTSHWSYLVVLFPIVGAFLTIVGWKWRRHLTAKARDYRRATGIVVGSSKGTSGGFDPAPVYRPIFEYSLDGRRFSAIGDVGYGRAKEEGTKVAIVYDPENPSVAFISEDYYFAPNIFLAIGTMFVLMGSWFTYLVFAGQMTSD
jgi:hypothetical protein